MWNDYILGRVKCFLNISPTKRKQYFKLTFCTMQEAQSKQDMEIFFFRYWCLFCCWDIGKRKDTIDTSKNVWTKEMGLSLRKEGVLVFKPRPQISQKYRMLMLYPACLLVLCLAAANQLTNKQQHQPAHGQVNLDDLYLVPLLFWQKNGDKSVNFTLNNQSIFIRCLWPRLIRINVWRKCFHWIRDP